MTNEPIFERAVCYTRAVKPPANSRILRTVCVVVALLPRYALAGDAWDPWQEKPTSFESERYSPAWLNRTLSEATHPTKLVGLFTIRMYQSLLGSVLPSQCQFHPSCSRYTFAAVASHGLLNGTILGAERISRCHSFAILGGYPVRSHHHLLDDPIEGKRAPLPYLQWLGL